MFVFMPGSIPPVRFGPVESDPPDGSISSVTYIKRLTLRLKGLKKIDKIVVLLLDLKILNCLQSVYL